MINRFKGLDYPMSVVGKTGTFPVQKVSAFLGKFQSNDKEYFAVFNSQENVVKARSFQDDWAKVISVDIDLENSTVDKNDFFPIKDLVVEIY